MTVVLRENPDPNDDTWSFKNVAIPISQNRQMGKMISFKNTGITLQLIAFPKNRILHGDDPSKFILTTFGDLRFPDAGLAVTRDYMTNLFKAGLSLNGKQYRFYGHSNSQLRGRSCFLREAQNDGEIDTRISLLGDFDNIKNAAKKAKRIGLLFSEASIDWTLDPKHTKDIPDITMNGELFSDGCGLISRRQAMLLAKHKKIRFHGKNYTPTVYQIRYKGYKGVLMLHPDLDARREALVAFRASQKKFTATGDNIFSVVDYSVPYAYGRLNDDIVVLLASLGVTTEQFQRKQQQYFDWIARSSVEWEIAFDFLCSLRNFDLAERVLLDGLDNDKVQKNVQALQNSEIASFKKKDHYRTRTIIHKSRLIFGVCDPYQVLKEGEVHVRIMEPRKGATTLTNIDFLVVRNPCLHPGDCLKLRAVSHPKLAHLVDCVVFPTVGRRAAPSMSSGGDLDGDKYFILFDPDIMPPKAAESYTYPEGKPPPPKNVTREDLARHFASYNASDLARVSGLHRKWVIASPNGAMSAECQELNALHSLSVDGGRINIPDRLKNPPKLDGKGYVLNVLAEAAQEFAERFLEVRKSTIREIPPKDAHDILSQFLSTERLGVTEYELASLGFNLAQRNGLNPRNYMSHTDLGALTISEKYALIVQLGLSPEEQVLIWNSLVRSDIIQPRELNDRNLNQPLRFQRLYTSRIQGRAAFFEYLTQAMEDFTRKLIIMKTDDRFAAGIFVKGRLNVNEDDDIDENVAVCSFMAKAGGAPTTYRRGTKGYKIHFGENIFEVFNRQRADTFIFATRPPPKAGADVVTSIALQKISENIRRQLGRLNRTPVVDMEIHVISNRDRVAHQAFDLRFEHVETTEFLRRFDHKPVPYTPNTLSSVDWSNYPATQKQIFTTPKEIAQTHIQLLEMNVLEELMNFAYERRAEEQLFWLFENLLDRDHSRIATHISRHPPLSYVVLKRHLVEDSTLPPSLAGFAYILLRGVIRSANELKMASLVALEKMAQQIRDLDFRQYSELLWLACLSVRHRQLVQEVLLVLNECRQNPGESALMKYAHKEALAIVFDHVEEAADECPTDDQGKPTRQKTAPVRAKLVPPKKKDNVDTAEEPKSLLEDDIVCAHIRVDALSTIRIHSHIRLQVASPAEHSVISRAVIDGIVTHAGKGEIMLQVMHPLPPEFMIMDWNIYTAGSIATSRAMLDAVLRLVEEREECCRFYKVITGSQGSESTEEDQPPESVDAETLLAEYVVKDTLNSSQRHAINVALTQRDGMTLIWGPPGTGKTTVIVQILQIFVRQVLEETHEDNSPRRILMTASTHNAVDNVLERFLAENEVSKLLRTEQILRVATDISRVSKAHQKYTVDARVGGNVNEDSRLLRQAEKRLKEARLIFTTCAGAGLGIMRKLDFPVVLIDEASQITEPTALISLVKGCQRAVLVGDHVQLRPTVKPMGAILQYDISLLERLYAGPPNSKISRTMLEIQYRFSDAIGNFPSSQFYEGRLRSGLVDKGSDPRLTASAFPWPINPATGGIMPTIFVSCAAEEDYGRSSKSNSGQVKMVKEIVSVLRTRHQGLPDATDSDIGSTSIAILTPYSRQVAQLKAENIQDVIISTIDGFQGRESDIVIFSTVRCNAEGDIGFVEDARRLNVAWTRPKLALIIVGDRRTLETNSPLWARAIQACSLVEISLPSPESDK